MLLARRIDSKTSSSSVLTINRDIIEHVHPFLKQHVYKFLKSYSQEKNVKSITRKEFVSLIKTAYK